MTITIPSGRTLPLKAKAGGGFESAVSAVGGDAPLAISQLDGNLNNGSRLRITTDGTYNFGTKPEPASVLHDFGDTAYERGTENTFNAGIADDTAFANSEAGRVWSSVVDGVLKSDSGLQRHSNASRFYRLSGGSASLREPKTYEDSGRSDGNRTLYHWWWQRSKYNATWLRGLNPSSITGTFISEEPIVVNGLSGTFISYTPGSQFEYVISVPGERNNNNLFGQTVVGQTSGAEMVYPATTNSGSPDFDPYTAIPGSKIGRWWDNPSGTLTGQIRLSMALHDGYIQLHNSTRAVEFFQNLDQVAGKWMLYEQELEVETGFWRHVVDGVVRVNSSGFGPIGDPNFSLAVSQFGTDGGPLSDQVTDIAEAGFDYSFHRVVLSTSATWDISAPREIQRLIQWPTAATPNNPIEIALNLGGLSGFSPLYLYVIGGNSEPLNTSGVEVI